MNDEWREKWLTQEAQADEEERKTNRVEKAHADLVVETEVLAELAAPPYTGSGRIDDEVADALGVLSPDDFDFSFARDAFEALTATLDEQGRPDFGAAARKLKGDSLTWFGTEVVGKCVSATRLPSRVKRLRVLAYRRKLEAAHREAGLLLAQGDVNSFHAALYGLDAEAEADVLIAPPFDDPPPPPILWRQPADGQPDWKDPFLAEGEVAVLSGPGKAGKSTVALAIARAMAHGSTAEPHGQACGLNVAKGAFVFLGYEDAARILAQRMLWYGDIGYWGHARLVAAPEPLWHADPDDPRTSRPSPWWNRFWNAVRAWGARLVVVDPAAVAFAGASNDGAQVRAFIAAVRAQAEALDLGVLILAHDTKAARSETFHSGLPGAGAVQGSSQWTDGTRGLLHLARLPKERRIEYADKAVLLQCVHSNYGPSDWGMVLEPQYAQDGRWHGVGPSPVERIDNVGEWAAQAKRDAQAARVEDKALARAQAFADWLEPVTEPVRYRDFKAAFENDTDVKVSANVFSAWLKAHGVATKKKKLDGTAVLCVFPSS